MIKSNEETNLKVNYETSNKHIFCTNLFSGTNGTNRRTYSHSSSLELGLGRSGTN